MLVTSRYYMFIRALSAFSAPHGKTDARGLKSRAQKLRDEIKTLCPDAGRAVTALKRENKELSGERAEAD